MISSLLFAGTMCGFTMGTLLVPRIMNFLGLFYLGDPKLALLPISPFRIAFSSPPPNAVGYSASQARYLALILASFGPPINYIMMGSKQGFPTMFMAYVVVAFARAVSTGICNVLDAPCLGYAFGVWSLGGVASPLIFQATAAAGLPWANFYFGSLVLAAASFVFLGITFYPTTREFALDRKNALTEADSLDRGSSPLTPDSDDVPDVSSGPNPVPSPPVNRKWSNQILSTMPYQWAVSLWVLLYCGSETTTQGLMVQYLLAERSANRKTVGYVSSGFWAGTGISRIAWSYLSPSISFTSRKYIVQGCLGLALTMQLLIWLIKSDLENAVSAALFGVFVGPVYPACLELANDLLPVELNMVSMAIVSASGSLGSAIFPFITGVVTTKYSMRCWSYITVTQGAILFGTWYLFPTRQPPRRAVAL
ncbi:major facilitator superfamily domain-containing protein [Mycena leptocephala]|nr:major facilitator superfamily domain-containing protein [Mycena leptocephala]